MHANQEKTTISRNSQHHHTAIIDVGGGFRAIFGAGVLDYCLEHHITFDHCYGISAGSANLGSFLSGQHGRNHKFYTEYAFRRQYASTHNFVTTHNFVDLEYVYGTLSNHDGEYPVDFEAFNNNPTDFTVIACNALDGTAHYFNKQDISFDNLDPLKASSCVPVACEPYVIDGIPFFDGGIADPIPVQRAIDDGYDRIVIILTRPVDLPRIAQKDLIPARILHHTYPHAAEKLANRYRTYNDEIALAQQLQEDGKVCILAPKAFYGLSTLHKSFEGLEQMYRKGYIAGRKIVKFLKNN